MWEDPRLVGKKLSKQCVYVFDSTSGKLEPRFQMDFGTVKQPNGIEVQWDFDGKEMDASDVDAYEGVLVVDYQNLPPRRR